MKKKSEQPLVDRFGYGTDPLSPRSVCPWGGGGAEDSERPNSPPAPGGAGSSPALPPRKEGGANTGDRPVDNEPVRWANRPRAGPPISLGRKWDPWGLGDDSMVFLQDDLPEFWGGRFLHQGISPPSHLVPSSGIKIDPFLFDD
jgi:hypothetical protein